MTRGLFSAAVLALVALGAQAQVVPTYQPQVVLVQFEAGVSIAEGASKTHHAAFDLMAAPYRVKSVERAFPILDHMKPTPATARNLRALRRTWYVRYQSQDHPRKVSSQLAAVDGVAHAEPVLINRLFSPMIDPDDSLFSQQSYLKLMKLPEAWNDVKGADGNPRVVIAITDGGGDWRHEDLRANVWTNADEIPDNGIDDDNNGFIDDVHGVNFANEDPNNNDPTGLPSTPHSAAHGTQTAGAASAVTDNGTGIAGAAWNAELMHINVGCSIGDGYICYGYEGLLYAAMNGADIVNASWGGYAPADSVLDIVGQLMDLITDTGTLVVAASGNDGVDIATYRSVPAFHPRVLSVGATERDSRKLAWFSNYGWAVSVFAPGTDILMTVPDDGYARSTGTSFAAPLTAGVAALVKTRFPNLGPDGVREQVRLTAESMDAENPTFAGSMGRGYVNAHQAVQSLTLPGVRVKRWWLQDSDGDGMIESGENVTVKVVVVNYLADSQNLSVGLVPAFGTTYPFLNFTTSEVAVGVLAGGDSTVVDFEFAVDGQAPDNQRVQLFTRVVDGTLEDTADLLQFGVNKSVEIVFSALKALYDSTDGGNWWNNYGWDTTSVPTFEGLQHWFGLQLRQSWLEGISLRSNFLTGTLPDELQQLPNLKMLNLNGNFLSGPMPPVLAEMKSLEMLFLNGNYISGSLPPELGNMANLKHFEMTFNSLSGALPPEIGNMTSLQTLALDYNALTHALPPELGNATKLEYLTARSNTLTESLPAELGNLRNLQVLDLSFNDLSGSIPSSFGNLSDLAILDLGANGLTGSIPAEFGNLRSLGLLALGGNDLDGPIPGELGNLSTLQVLELAGNELTGAIPESLGRLSQLRQLRLSGNWLEGAMPDELGRLTELVELNAGNNELSGSIPESFGDLSRLLLLNLGGNKVEGAIPASLGNLENLQTLRLSKNRLDGVVPEEFGNLKNLQSLGLDRNYLAGKLPRTLMKLDSLQEFHFGGGQLLCAPRDAAFQDWLAAIPTSTGNNCQGLYITAGIDDLTFTQTVAITDLVLPDAADGTAPYDYTLTPALPAGLTFDAATRTLSGTPTAAMAPARYKYLVTDAAAAADSMFFTIEVISSPLSSDAQDVLPQDVVLHSNYPNPFVGTTRIMLDLPEAAEVTVTVMDMLGRTVQQTDAGRLPAGKHHEIAVDGRSLSAGAYPYRVVVRTGNKSSIRAGVMIRMQ